MTSTADKPAKAGTAGGERPTLKSIARLTGLAVPTVSRALNDAPDIGTATKQRVREVAAEIGYRPNRAGLRLRTGKTNVVALVLSTEHDMMNHTARLISSIAAATRDTPYHMIVTPYFPNEDPMAAVRYVTETRSADGLILNQIMPEDPRVAYLMRQQFPFATHGRTIWSDQHPYYDFHNGVFARICVQKLVARGRRKLMLIAPPADQNYAIEMESEARDEAQKLGIELDVLAGATSDSLTSEIMAQVADRIRSGPHLDGVICGSTSAAMAAVAAAEADGRRLGRDIDLAAKEALPFLELFRSEIIVVDEDVTRAGTFLCKALMQAIDHPDLPKMQYLEVPEG